MIHFFAPPSLRGCIVDIFSCVLLLLVLVLILCLLCHDMNNDMIYVT